MQRGLQGEKKIPRGHFVSRREGDFGVRWRCQLIPKPSGKGTGAERKRFGKERREGVCSATKAG